MESSAIGKWLLGRKNWGFAQVLDELWWMSAVVMDISIAQASTHFLESLVVHKASCILGYVELTLLDVLAELPTT